MKLWHYTCSHYQSVMGWNAALRPGLDGYVWLTDLDNPNVAGLGLTSQILDCDRTEHRYRVVDDRTARPWTEERLRIPRAFVEALESVPGVLPRHWWVARTLVPVTYDPIRRST